MIRNSLSYGTLSVFFHDISMMIASGTPMDDILAVLAGDCTDSDFASVLAEMLKTVSEGGSLGSAMKKTGCFPEYALNMTNAAEEVGKLEDVAFALSQYYEQREKTRALIKSAVTRPLFLLAVISAIMGAFIFAILPAISKLYDTLGGDASIYIISSYIIGGASFAAILLALFLALCVWICSRTGSGRKTIYGIWTKNRATSETALLFAKAQFVSDIDVRLSGGILLDSALEQAAENVAHKEFRTAAKKCADRVFAGESLGTVLLDEKLLPPIYTHIMFGALQSGESEKAFHKVKEMLFDEAQQKSESLINRIEPLLTGFFTLSVGLSLLSVMLPLIGVITAMG